MTMSTDENKSTRPQTWKCRLKGWQYSMRQSIRVKKRSPQKTNSKVSDRLSPENCAGKHAQTGSSSPRRNDNKSHFGCESCNAKHGAVSDLDGRRGKVFAKPTANGQLMNEKTMIDRREVVKRTFERRKQRSNNNIIESKNSCLQQRNETAVRLNGHVKQSSTNNSQGRAEHNSRTTLHRPKSLIVLTSLFKRSSGPSRAQSINTERGNRKDSQSSEVWELKDRHSTHESTEEKFVWKCDPNYSSCESFSDSELSPRLSSKYYSLKRSKASLIYPRSPKSEWRPRKGKSRTFCCEGELRNSRKREFQSIVFQQELRNEIAREMSRSVCLLSRERRSLSDILSADDLRDYHISDREIPSRTSSVDKRRSNWSCNQKSFNDYSTRSYTSTSSIPILGVTLVDSEGNKRTINPLHHDDADYCEESLKGCKATRTDMCKTNRGIMRVRALKTTQSNPEIYRIENDPAKGEKSLPRKENSSYRYSSLDGLDDSDLDSNSLVLSDSSNTDDFIARSLSLTSRNRSLNRSTGSLEVSSDSKTTKVRKLENEHDKICQTSERDEQKVSDDVSMTIEGSQNRDIPSNLNPVRDSDRNKSRAIHGSFCNDFDVVQSSSLPSRFSGRGLMEDEPDDVMMTPRLSSTTEDRQEWRERRRALSNDNSPKFYNYNREHKFRGQPPSVRPRIQSLEELSPMAVDEIMKKKQSVLSRARMRHSKSVPNGESPEENLREIGRRLSGNDFSLSLDSSALSRNEELFASSDSLTSNKSTISASDMESLSSLGSAKYLSPPTTPGLNGPSNGFSRSLSVDEGSFGSPVDFDDHESLDCAPVKGTERPTRFRRKRLGKSTGDLNFDRSEELNQRRELTEEDMEVPEAFAEALWDHVTMDPEELTFRAGDVITVISMTNVDWWFGQVRDQVGWFPAPFVRVRVSQTLGDEENRLIPPFRSRRGTNEGLLTKDDVRARVVNEILNTEKDYVKNLSDVVEGYLCQAQKRVDMFSEDQIYLLFSNIEQIYEFHQKLLLQLEDCYLKDNPCDSMIGRVFLENKEGFQIYSEYCNNHPHAIAELKTLCESNNYKHFFEACRLLQDMINISLDGFLLTPVQKICKYPLQLAELLKHTYPTHKDYDAVHDALRTMKEVASLINERKRKVENIYKIAKWQATIEGWEGENVLERSSELIHSGDVHKISLGTSQERVFFLFDNQLIYCKKDILRKNGLSYKGRIDMNSAHVTWVEDKEESYKNEPLVNAWKIYNETKNKWYVVYTKTAEQKERWRLAFTEERRRVKQDVEFGLVIPQPTRRAAMRAANASIKGKKERAAERRERFVRSASEFMKSPPSPTLRLPPPVSSADLIREESPEDTKTDKTQEGNQIGFLQRTSVIRRSFGLRGSGRKKNKDKRMSSVF